MRMEQKKKNLFGKKKRFKMADPKKTEIFKTANPRNFLAKIS